MDPWSLENTTTEIGFIETHQDAWTSAPEDDFNIFYLYTDNKVFFRTFVIEEHIWNQQRPVDFEKVGQISNVIETAMSRGFSTPNKQITIGTVLKRNPVIMDGQHRCCAYRQTESKIKINIQLIDYPSETERFEGFKEINSNTALPSYYKDPDSMFKEISERIFDILPDSVEKENRKGELKSHIYQHLKDNQGNFDECEIDRGHLETLVLEEIDIISGLYTWREAYTYSRDAIISIKMDKCRIFKSKTSSQQCPYTARYRYNQRTSRQLDRCKRHCRDGEERLYHARTHSDLMFGKLSRQDKYLIFERCGWMEKSIKKLSSYNDLNATFN